MQPINQPLATWPQAMGPEVLNCGIITREDEFCRSKRNSTRHWHKQT